MTFDGMNACFDAQSDGDLSRWLFVYLEPLFSMQCPTITSVVASSRNYYCVTLEIVKFIYTYKIMAQSAL